MRDVQERTVLLFLALGSIGSFLLGHEIAGSLAMRAVFATAAQSGLVSAPASGALGAALTSSLATGGARRHTALAGGLHKPGGSHNGRASHSGQPGGSPGSQTGQAQAGQPGSTGGATTPPGTSSGSTQNSGMTTPRDPTMPDPTSPDATAPCATPANTVGGGTSAAPDGAPCGSQNPALASLPATPSGLAAAQSPANPGSASSAAQPLAAQGVAAPAPTIAGGGASQALTASSLAVRPANSVSAPPLPS